MKEKHTTNQKLIFNLIKKCVFGVIVLIVAFIFVYNTSGNPYHEYLLMNYGATANGFITDATEDVNDDNRGKPHFSVDYKYTFTTDDGRKINSSGHSSGRLPDELCNSTNHFPTKVVYLKDNPEINKIKITLCDSLGELLWRKVGIGFILLLCCSSIGIILIRNAIKDYLIEKKNINT